MVSDDWNSLVTLNDVFVRSYSTDICSVLVERRRTQEKTAGDTAFSIVERGERRGEERR